MAPYYTSQYGGPSPRRVRRPFGVSLLAIYDGLIIGIAPAVLAMMRYFSVDMLNRPPVLDVFGAVVLSGATIFTAAAVWRGESWSRYVLVGLVIIYYLGLYLDAGYAYDLITRVGMGEFEDTVRTGRSAFWIVLHIWYLLFSRAARYFQAKPATSR